MIINIPLQVMSNICYNAYMKNDCIVDSHKVEAWTMWGHYTNWMLFQFLLIEYSGHKCFFCEKGNREILLRSAWFFSKSSKREISFHSIPTEYRKISLFNDFQKNRTKILLWHANDNNIGLMQKYQTKNKRMLSKRPRTDVTLIIYHKLWEFTKNIRW